MSERQPRRHQPRLPRGRHGDRAARRARAERDLQLRAPSESAAIIGREARRRGLNLMHAAGANPARPAQRERGTLPPASESPRAALTTPAPDEPRSSRRDADVTPALSRGCNRQAAARAGGSTSSNASVTGGATQALAAPRLQASSARCPPRHEGHRPALTHRRHPIVDQLQGRLDALGEELIGQVAVGQRPGQLQRADHESEERERVGSRRVGVLRL
jgi:hypothetical protein